MFAPPDYRSWQLDRDQIDLGMTIWEPTSGAGRRRGLLECAAIDPDQGLLLVGAPVIHMVGMQFPIELIFLSRKGYIHSIRAARPGWRLYAAWSWRCLELAAGTVSRLDLACGQQLRLHPLTLIAERDPRS